MKKVLVTGANGLLGANLVRLLTKSGYSVKAMVRKGSNLTSLDGCKQKLFIGNIANEIDVNEAVSDCDFVIHTAARTSQTPSSLSSFYEANIKATNLLIEASKKYKIKRFIFVSTANCFTNGSLLKPGDETGGFMPWLKQSGYAYSKYLAQQEVLLQVEKYQFPAIVVNPTFMLGKLDTKPSSGALLLYGYNKRLVFYPSGGKSFVNVEAVAEAITQSLLKGQIGETYLLAGENATYKRFFQLIRKQNPNRQLLIQIPRFILIFIGYLVSVIEKYLSVSLPLNITNARLISLDNYFTNTKAKKDLGLVDTNLKSSILDSIDWFKQNGQIK